jgi:hypothetical protein
MGYQLFKNNISRFNLMSNATICFDCPGKNANFHLDEAKRSIDNGDYVGAKNHIDQAKQIIGQISSSSTNQTANK